MFGRVPIAQRIPTRRYTDGAWRPHFDEYDVIKDPQNSMNVSAEGIHEREKVLYRKVETFFWGGVVADLLIAERAESHG